MDENTCMDLLMIGKIGNGKSATGNSILQKSQQFKAKPSTEPVTTEIQSDTSTFNGRTINIVDGPGVGDTRMNGEDASKLSRDQLEKAMALNPRGFNALLLVVRYGGRFTREDIQTINSLKHIFGMDFVKNYCILIITCGDILESDVEETEMNFDQWLQAQGGYFKTMLEECNRRVVLFDNKTKDEAKKNAQLTCLVSVVDSLGGKRYTMEEFENTTHLREKLIIESVEARVREETLNEVTALSGKLQSIQSREVEHQTKDLVEMMKDASKLYQSVQDQDKGTGALKYSLEVARSFVARVKTQSDHCEKVLHDRKKVREEQEKIEADFTSKLEAQNQEHERRLKEEKERDEQRSKEERQAMEKKREKEKQEEAARQEEQLKTLRAEMENKNEEQRRQQEQTFAERLRN